MSKLTDYRCPECPGHPKRLTLSKIPHAIDEDAILDSHREVRVECKQPGCALNSPTCITADDALANQIVRVNNRADEQRHVEEIRWLQQA